LLSESKKATLEEDFRKHKRLQREALIAIIDSNVHDEDVNAWIKGSREHSQQALSQIIQKETNRIYQNRMLKYDAVCRARERLSDELKRIVDVYMWGEYSYLGWKDIADREGVSNKTSYNWRTKILTTYAEELGEI
jgi:hypothetical protein